MNRLFQKILFEMRKRTGAAERMLETRADDCFITSYPRSGNTLMRFLLANLIWPQEATFENINQRIPSVHSASLSQLEDLERPRLLKSHEYFQPRYPKVIYIARDIRSVVTSYYYFKLRHGVIDQTVSMHQFTEKFLEGSLDGYGTWSDHVGSWLAMRGGQGEAFLLIRYEDLRSQPAEWLAKAAGFLDLEATQEQIERAVRLSSFNRMKLLEKKAGRRWRGGRALPGGPSFVRHGSDDEWRVALERKTQRLLLATNREMLQALGYLS